MGDEDPVHRAQPAQPEVPPREFYQALVDRMNGPRPLTVKNLPGDNFKSGQDFELFVVGFVDNVRVAHGLATDDQRIPGLCLNWIPCKLELGATRAVYDNLPDTVKGDWTQLRAALSRAFKDEGEEIFFLSRDDAWKRTPGMSLIDYKNGLLHRLRKFQPDLKSIQGEWDRACVRRFRVGLQNPVLEAHILMNATGPNHNLDYAYQIAANYENTLNTIGQSGSRSAAPNMAAMFNIPHVASFEAATPQLGALSTQQEKTNDRLDALETSAKKTELDLSELRAGLTEVKEGVKTIKEDLARDRANPRPYYARPARPLYPVARMPLNTFNRPYYPQNQSYQGARPRIAAGLTGGPGYVTSQPALQSQANSQTSPQGNAQAQRPAQNYSSSQSTQMGSSSCLTLPQRPPGPAMGSMEERRESSESTDVKSSFPNPHIQHGQFDAGYGWTGLDLNDAVAHGYDLAPEGMYVYSDLPF